MYLRCDLRAVRRHFGYLSNGKGEAEAEGGLRGNVPRQISPKQFLLCFFQISAVGHDSRGAWRRKSNLLTWTYDLQRFFSDELMDYYAI